MMKKNDQEIQKRYLEKLARARTTRDLVNPDESILENRPVSGGQKKM